MAAVLLRLPLKDSAARDELLADGSMVLFHTTSRLLMTLNPTAALVWEYCDGSHSPAAIAQTIRAVFPVGPTGSVIADDVDAILRDLQEHGMLRDGPSHHAKPAASM